MKLRSTSIAIALAALAAITAGCQSTTEDIRAMAAPAPKRIDSDPEGTGLVVMDVELQLERGQGLPINGIGLMRAGGDTVVIQGPYEDLVVFPALEPGTWGVRFVGAPWAFYESPSRFPLPESEGGIFDVPAGIPLYVGRVTIRRMSQTDFEYFWDRSADAEIAAWQRVLDKWPETTWSERIHERLGRLRGQADG